MEVIDSTFSRGYQNNISGLDAIIAIQNVYMHDLESPESGLGLTCARCKYVGIRNSRFKNLVSTTGSGGAIYLSDLTKLSQLETSFILDTVFEGN